MNTKKLVWLKERKEIPLKVVNRSKISDVDRKLYESKNIMLSKTNLDEIFLEGEVAEFGTLENHSENENDRWYTKEPYLEEVDRLQPIILGCRLFGALDHDDDYAVKMKEVSHMITELYFCEERQRVIIRIKLIPTIIGGGMDAIAIVNAGGNLSISARAIGYYDEETHEAVMDTIFTYDIVDTPGMAFATLNIVETRDNLLIADVSEKDLSIINRLLSQKKIITLNENKMTEPIKNEDLFEIPVVKDGVEASVVFDYNEEAEETPIILVKVIKGEDVIDASIMTGQEFLDYAELVEAGLLSTDLFENKKTGRKPSGIAQRLYEAKKRYQKRLVKMNENASPDKEFSIKVGSNDVEKATKILESTKNPIDFKNDEPTIFMFNNEDDLYEAVEILGDMTLTIINTGLEESKKQGLNESSIYGLKGIILNDTKTDIGYELKKDTKIEYDWLNDDPNTSTPLIPIRVNGEHVGYLVNHDDMEGHDDNLNEAKSDDYYQNYDVKELWNEVSDTNKNLTLEDKINSIVGLTSGKGFFDVLDDLVDFGIVDKTDPETSKLLGEDKTKLNEAKKQKLNEGVTLEEEKWYCERYDQLIKEKYGDKWESDEALNDDSLNHQVEAEFKAKFGKEMLYESKKVKLNEVTTNGEAMAMLNDIDKTIAKRLFDDIILTFGSIAEAQKQYEDNADDMVIKLLDVVGGYAGEPSFEPLFESKKRKLNEAKEVEFPNSNLHYKGSALDSNGNRVVKIGFPNERGFSIQTLGTLPKTHSIVANFGDKDLSDQDLSDIEKEVIDYVDQYGTETQKSRLKKYGALKENKRIKLNENSSPELDGIIKWYDGGYTAYDLYDLDYFDKAIEQYEYEFSKKISDEAKNTLLKHVNETNEKKNLNESSEPAYKEYTIADKEELIKLFNQGLLVEGIVGENGATKEVETIEDFDNFDKFVVRFDNVDESKKQGLNESKENAPEFNSETEAIRWFENRYGVDLSNIDGDTIKEKEELFKEEYGKSFKTLKKKGKDKYLSKYEDVRELTHDPSEARKAYYDGFYVSACYDYVKYHPYSSSYPRDGENPVGTSFTSINYNNINSLENYQTFSISFNKGMEAEARGNEYNKNKELPREEIPSYVTKRRLNESKTQNLYEGHQMDNEMGLVDTLNPSKIQPSFKSEEEIDDAYDDLYNEHGDDYYWIDNWGEGKNDKEYKGQIKALFKAIYGFSPKELKLKLKSGDNNLDESKKRKLNESSYPQEFLDGAQKWYDDNYDTARRENYGDDFESEKAYDDADIADFMMQEFFKKYGVEHTILHESKKQKLNENTDTVMNEELEKLLTKYDGMQDTQKDAIRKVYDTLVKDGETPEGALEYVKNTASLNGSPLNESVVEILPSQQELIDSIEFSFDDIVKKVSDKLGSAVSSINESRKLKKGNRAKVFGEKVIILNESKDVYKVQYGDGNEEEVPSGEVKPLVDNTVSAPDVKTIFDDMKDDAIEAIRKEEFSSVPIVIQIADLKESVKKVIRKNCRKLCESYDDAKKLSDEIIDEVGLSNGEFSLTGEVSVPTTKEIVGEINELKTMVSTLVAQNEKLTAENARLIASSESVISEATTKISTISESYKKMFEDVETIKPYVVDQAIKNNSVDTTIESFITDKVEALKATKPYLGCLSDAQLTVWLNYPNKISKEVIEEQLASCAEDFNAQDILALAGMVDVDLATELSVA